MSRDFSIINNKIETLQTNFSINNEQLSYLTSNVNKLLTDGIKVTREEPEEEVEQVQIELATGTAAGAGTNGLTEVNFTPALATHLSNIPAGGGGTGTNSLATGTASGGGANGLTQVNFTPTLMNKLMGIQDGAQQNPAVGDGGLTQKNFTVGLKNNLDTLRTGGSVWNGTRYVHFTHINFTDVLKNKLDGIDANANVGIEHLHDDITPQLGGNLDVNGKGLISTNNGNISIAPNGTGNVVLGAGGVNVSSGREITNVHNIQSTHYSHNNSTMVSATRQANFTDLELKPHAGGSHTLLAYGNTGDVEMDGTLSVDIIQEKTSGNGVDIGLSGGVNVSSNREITNVHNIQSTHYSHNNATMVSATRQANFTDLELKPHSGGSHTLLASGNTGSVEMDGTLSVDTINENGTNSDISITPNGNGNVVLHGLKWPSSDGNDGDVLKTDSSGNLSWTAQSSGGGGGGSGIANLHEDGSPQLGANLDVNGKTITSVSNGNISLLPDGSGVVEIKGNTAGSGQIQLNCEDNSHGIKIKGPPHSAGATYTLTLPDDDGTNGQVLKTDGSGNLSWTTQSSGGGGGGSSYIESDNTVAITHFPLGPSGPSFSEPAESLKLIGNLRLQHTPGTPAGSLSVEDQLIIKNNSSNTAYNSIYVFSGFNHPLGPIVDAANPTSPWGTTNVILGDTNRFAANLRTAIESAEECEIAIRPQFGGDSIARLHLDDYGNVRLKAVNKLTLYVGEADGSTTLPLDSNDNPSPFYIEMRAGGYTSSANNIQQDGYIDLNAGTIIKLGSPIIYIGKLNYGPGIGTNSTHTINMYADTGISMSTPIAEFEQDINIGRSIGINGDYGTAGKVLTSGGSGSAMTWSNCLTPWNPGTNPSFRSDMEIDMMGQYMTLGQPGVEYSNNGQHPHPRYFPLQCTGFDQNSHDSGSNYTKTMEIGAAHTFITSVPTPPSMGMGDSWIPSNEIRLRSGSLGGGNHMNGNKPEILLEVDNQDYHNSQYPTTNSGNYPNQGSWPMIRIAAGSWNTYHDSNPTGEQQNAGFLHMAAGRTAALLSRRVYIGKAKNAGLTNFNSPLGLTHDGYGRDFNNRHQTSQSQDAYDPCIGYHNTDILSLSADNIEIVSGNTVQIYGQVSAQTQILNSDDRLKHNEEDLTNSLDVIRKLKPQKYQKTNTLKKADFNGILEEGSYVNETGFIAQDILNVPELAYCVTGGDFTKTLTDSEGVEKEVNIEKPYSVNYNDIFTRNVSATQELDTIVTNLLTKIATLEARITELENK